MKIMVCPLNGPRNITEFACGGDVRSIPDPATCSDAAWTDYLFIEDNVAGVIDEWWLHTPSNTWFIARRNTLTDEILATMTVGDYFDGKPSGSDTSAPQAAGSTGGRA